MIEIDWHKDYQREFVCPHCGQQGLRLAGKRRKRNFRCPNCQKNTAVSHKIKIPEPNSINWRRDYQGEFICPHCDEKGLWLAGFSSKGSKRQFICRHCQKTTRESNDIKLPDPNSQINWRRDYRVGEFACPNPNCHAREVRLFGSHGGRKQMFRCQACETSCSASIDLTPQILSQFSPGNSWVKSFLFEEDRWDLRSLICSDYDQNTIWTANFENVELDWFKSQVKRYIYHLCKLNKPPTTILSYLTNLRVFSRYLAQKDLAGIEAINRGVILDFLTGNKVKSAGMRHRLATLRNFFEIGTIQGWFEVDQHIIRDEDLPKKKQSNPDPISDTVREQIEKNLDKLPDPIARMWIIAFFTAMRPSELALLKKDCLIQEGSHWKIVWQRNKTKDHHEVPVTRIIAQVVQEQQEYIQKLWGDEWDYLFCHYQGLSTTDPSQPNLKPVKKVISQHRSSLQIAICCLIQAEDIRDDNGNIAQFSPRLIRATRLTELFKQGHELVVVSAWAGHRKLATTSTYYTHVSCNLIEKETGHIQKALFNADGQALHYESLPKSFWKNPRAHQLELSGDHINTPIYGYCGLPLEQRCDKFRACYTCPCFVAVPEKLTQYVKTRDELRAKESRARASGADVLVEQYQRQAEQLDKIIASLEDAA